MRGDDRARGGVSAIFHSQVCGTAVNNNTYQPAPTLVGIIVIIGRFTRRRAPRASRPSRPPFAMRAAVYDRTAVEGVRVVTRPPPTAPARDALLVRVRACGVNPVDAKGVVGDKLPAFLRPLARRALDGTIAGFDLSGVVDRAPPNSGFAVGDEVFGAVPPFRGSFAELVRVPLHQVAKKPASLSHAQAAALVLPGVTVTQLLDQHGFEPGQRLLIIGASGGVGHLAVKLAKARGAKSVVGVCSAANAAFVRSCGADAVVAYDAECSETTRDSSGGAKEREIGNETTTPDAVVDELRRIVREDLGGHAFDLVLDAVTSGDARDAGFEYERRVRSAGLVKTPANGVDAHNYVTIGSRPVGWVLAAIKRVTGVNLFARGRELFWIRFPGCASDLAELARVCDGDASASGGRTSVAPAIEATLPLTSEGVAEAFRRLHSRRVRGKIVVEVT